MSEFIAKPNSFALFKNNKKEKDTHPDYVGDFTNDKGEKFRLAAWVRETNGGNKFFSGMVSEFKTKEQLAAEAGNSQPKVAEKTEDVDDLPF